MAEEEASQVRVLGTAIQVGEDAVILNDDQLWQLFFDLCKRLKVHVAGSGTPTEKDARH